MKIFVDSANLKEIEECLKRGFVSGITTNPSILAKEKKTDFREHIQSIISLVQSYKLDIPMSVEVFTTDPQEMIRQAEEFVMSFGEYQNLNIKVPIGWNELEVISNLRKRNIKVNCTCCMSYNQALMAANAGANYVSLFWGRIRDTGYDSGEIVRQVHETLQTWNSPSQIIVGSIRHIMDINQAQQAGADIVTVPPSFLPKLCAHPKTDEVVDQFLTDFREWLQR
jgi:transaldolase